MPSAGRRVPQVPLLGPGMAECTHHSNPLTCRLADPPACPYFKSSYIWLTQKLPSPVV